MLLGWYYSGPPVLLLGVPVRGCRFVVFDHFLVLLYTRLLAAKIRLRRKETYLSLLHAFSVRL